MRSGRAKTWWGRSVPFGDYAIRELIMRVLVALVGALACSQLCAAEPKLSAKVEKAQVPDALAEPLRKLLDEQALVVRDGDTELMTVWCRDTLSLLKLAENTTAMSVAVCLFSALRYLTPSAMMPRAALAARPHRHRRFPATPC